MIGFVGSLVMVGLVCGGAYLYYKVGQIEKKIVHLHDLPEESGDDKL